MSDELPRQESLDETRARLQLDGPPAPPEVIVAAPAASVSPDELDPDAPPIPRARRPKRPRSRKLAAKKAAPREAAPKTERRRPRVALVIVGIVVLAVAGFAVVHSAVDRPGTSAQSTGAWKHYPGTGYTDSSDVLAAPSEEQTAANAEAFVDEYKQALTTEFGLVWTKQYDGYSERASNDYGGTSMLYDYSTARWQGSAVLDDPQARARAYALFGTVAKSHGFDDVWLANDLYADDPAHLKKAFGGTTKATQLEWGFYADQTVSPGATAAGRVIDLNVPRAPSFEGDYWFVLDDVPPGSFVVTLYVSADSLLAESDRDAFRKAVSAYDESHKPEPH